jgi:hypothetical protein
LFLGLILFKALKLRDGLPNFKNRASQLSPIAASIALRSTVVALAPARSDHHGDFGDAELPGDPTTSTRSRSGFRSFLPRRGARLLMISWNGRERCSNGGALSRPGRKWSSTQHRMAPPATVF